MSTLRYNVVLTVLFAISAKADIIKVPQDQATIQAGIDRAVDGDTVLVDTGRYVENINFNGKNIVVGSLFLMISDTSYISRTVIDGDRNGTVVAFKEGTGPETILSGFTITNGFSSHGAGISIVDASPTLSHLRVVDNHALGGMGGGIFCSGSRVLIEHCQISRNSSGPDEVDAGGPGGGLAFENSDPILRNVVIENNVSLVFGDGYGGGVALFNSNPAFERTVITANIARGLIGGKGGGISMRDSSLLLTNVTVVGNAANGDAPNDGIYVESGHVYLVNSIVWDDTISSDCELLMGSQAVSVAYSDVIGGRSNIYFEDIGNCSVNWLEGNMDVDPLFFDPHRGDFHLQQQSPVIDAGTAFFVWEGDTLVNLPDTAYEGNAPDMGAFESPYSVAITQDKVIPIVFTIKQNYPNPFNPSTTIEFWVSQAGLVTLTVYDLLGREIETMLNRPMNPGRHKVQWNASEFPSGIYFVRMKAGDPSLRSGQAFTQTRKVTVLK